MTWLPKKTVLVPVDFSEPSLEAVRLARTMVETAAGLHVLHVLQPVQVIEPGVVWQGLGDEQRAGQVLQNLKEQLSDKELQGATVATRVGTPGLEITEYAREVGAELVVIPSHGYSGIKHFLLGSVAERVIRHAPCPVLVLRRAD